MSTPVELPVPHGFAELEPTTGFGAGFGPIYRDHGARRIGFRVGPQHVNPRQVCHGGALSTFADYQVTVAIEACAPLATAPPTISLSIDYLAPAPLGAWVEAEVTVLRETRSLLFTQAVMSVDDVPVARSNAIYRKATPRS